MHLIHCSYHKCLTVYYRRVFGTLCNRVFRWRGSYEHYNSHQQDFLDPERGFASHRLASLNNRALDPDRLSDSVGGPVRISRFLRDPRDLVVSGYFYHRRGAEPWTRISQPSEHDWYFANGCVPEGMRGRAVSFAAHLEELSEEEGLLAELEFRRAHFESMREWPEEHASVLCVRYEHIVADEVSAFERLFSFYQLPFLERWVARTLVRRHARRRPDPHVRDPTPAQWRRHFTPRIEAAFEEQHPGLLSELGYAADAQEGTSTSGTTAPADRAAELA